MLQRAGCRQLSSMRRPHPIRPGNGFTLIELIVGLAVLSILAAIAIPAHFGRPEVTLENAAALFARDVDAARSLAVLGDRPVRLVLVPDGYRVLTSDGAQLEHPRAGGMFLRDYARDAVFRGVRVELPAGRDAIEVQLEPLGGSSGAERIVLSFGDARRSLAIDHRRGVAEVLAPRD
jgi:prepilin-type N-terminal cleavage/methylation domain-containing protein